MRKPLLSSLALALLASTALPAAAQVAPGASPAPPATAPAPAPAPAAAPQAAGQPTFGQLMSSLNRMKSEVAQVRQLQMLSTNDVHLVKVQTLAQGSDTAALNSALSKNASQMTALRSALARVTLTASTDRHTLTFAEFLADNRLSMNQVVAADASSGTLIAFIQ